ncbi:MAG: RNA polymerase sigma factor RpoD/SigA [Lentisphaeraceae bacterium]|nr:RNA polymerase sigma factor RpoD/SigA [Lentisphaeraceae bacterium]
MRTEGYNGVHLYMNEIEEVPLLSRKEEYSLGERAVEGDPKAIDKLIVSNLRLVVKIANDFKGFGVSLNDLIAEGNLGLMRAANKFDPTKGAKFSSYSALWIKQSIRNALAKLGRTVRIPIQSISKISKIRQGVKDLKDLLKRDPTNQEVADYLDFPELTIRHLRNVNTENVSLHQKVLQKENSGELQDFVEDKNALDVAKLLDLQDCMGVMSNYMDQLKDRERLILTMRYGLNGQRIRTLEEVSQAINLTRERVRQIQIAAVEKIRRAMKLDGIVPY